MTDKRLVLLITINAHTPELEFNDSTEMTDFMVLFVDAALKRQNPGTTWSVELAVEDPDFKEALNG